MSANSDGRPRQQQHQHQHIKISGSIYVRDGSIENVKQVLAAAFLNPPPPPPGRLLEGEASESEEGKESEQQQEQQQEQRRQEEGELYKKQLLIPLELAFKMSKRAIMAARVAASNPSKSYERQQRLEAVKNIIRLLREDPRDTLLELLSLIPTQAITADVLDEDWVFLAERQYSLYLSILRRLVLEPEAILPSLMATLFNKYLDNSPPPLHVSTFEANWYPGTTRSLSAGQRGDRSIVELELGFKNFEAFVRAGLLINKQVVEVGSGNGRDAYHLLQRAKETNLDLQYWCVDPEPFAFRGLPADRVSYRPPDYARVEDLVIEHPTLVRNCGVVLVWPDNDARNPRALWDLKAIQALQPEWFVVLYEQYMAAGSVRLLSWLGRQCDLKPRYSCTPPDSYHRQAQMTLKHDDWVHEFEVMWAFYVRQDINPYRRIRIYNVLREAWAENPSVWTMIPPQVPNPLRTPPPGTAI